MFSTLKNIMSAIILVLVIGVMLVSIIYLSYLIVPTLLLLTIGGIAFLVMQHQSKPKTKRR